MRVSVRAGDPGYCIEALGAVVLVDGIAVNWCHTADEEEGAAYCYALEDGRPYVDPDRPDFLAETVHRGEVTIILAPPLSLPVGYEFVATPAPP